MKRDEILAYLSNKNIRFYFEYSPFSASTIDIKQKEFEAFFLEELVSYVVMNCGHPISGSFIARRENDDIILESDTQIEIDWSYLMITGGADGLFIGDTVFLDELECLIYKAYVSKGCSDWYYILTLNEVNSESSIELIIYEYDVETKLETELPEELFDFILRSVSGTASGTDYECDVLLTNSGEDNNFVERYKEKIVL